ncbi:TolC family protein [Hymenobacter aquaticus]|uniref:TolC family protein n=1 Tax=Hymenobacter aquaticus TaxID=1867101 RepID=A0A4Z0Q3K5_9BACT|nr:TolC family protein [Hymenobacter aquaticus]TGE23661.1 TolC family protein [Hymenobacter aquaticus]
MRRLPLLYSRLRRVAALLLAAGCLGQPAQAQQPAPAAPTSAAARTISLEEATTLALTQNRRLAIAREQVAEAQYKEAEVHAKRFPKLTALANAGYNTNKLDITVPRGSLGVYPATGPIPAADIPISEGSHTLVLGTVQAAQPLTQLLKIRTGEQVARQEVALARTSVRQAEWQVRQGVEKLYYGLLIAQQQQQQAELSLQAARKQRYDVESAQLAGKALPAQVLGAEANIADQEQKLLAVQNQRADYAADLNLLLGLPADTPLQLLPPPSPEEALQPLQTYLSRADTANLTNRQAAQTREKAALGVKAARQQYLPDVSLTANYIRIQGSPILPRNSLLVGGLLNWNIYDFGERQAVVEQRKSQQRQARENELYTREEVAGAVQKAYRQLGQAAALVAAARKATDLRAAELKIKQDALAAGKVLPVEVLSTQATLAKAQADLLAAQLNHRLALSELLHVSGQQ